MNNGITIIVCTYNGALRLPDTIKYLTKQSAIGKIGMEIIVVDNNSSDDSAKVAAEEWKKYNLKDVSFSVLHQLKPGKIYALELAVSKSRFEFMIICDDDNWLNPEYVLTMYHLLLNNPKIGAAGGRGIAFSDTMPLPDWLKDFEEGYAIGTQAEASSEVNSRGHLWGAGLGTRTSLYKQSYIDFPSLLTGRSGNLLTAGEDAEYCQRLILQGYSLYYCEDLLFHHYMPPVRLTLEYKERLYKGFDDSNSILNKYYLANKLIAKYKGNSSKRIRMRLLARLNIMISTSSKSREYQKDILTFLSGTAPKSNDVMVTIRKFYLEKSGDRFNS